jgi:hypothetical protein
MATFIPITPAGGITKAGAEAGVPSLAGGSALALAKVQNVVVDVGAATVVPTVVRAGEEVKSPQLNTDKVSDLVTRLVPITRIKVPRVVSQSIPAGTRIPKGTPVDLVLVPVSDIDFSLLTTVHDDLKAKSIESVLPLLSDPAVEPILKKDSVANLTDAEKATLTSKLAPIGVTVDNTVAGKSLDLAFQSLQSAKAFQ